MKNINFKTFLMLGVIVSFISCKAQTFPLNTLMDDIPQNAYVKDFNNELRPYIGIYKAVHDGNEITLYITKEENKLTKRANKQFYRDALVVKYIVKNSAGVVLQDTYNFNNPNIRFYSIGTTPLKNRVDFIYSGTNCNVGWGDIYLSKINATQISWDYRPDSMLTDKCPPGTDINIYLPVVDNLIFTKQ